ncbi:hypothetical protein ANN_02194 [Periplaneta americana]|uniref:Tc1-like transposase DDE domain-containing protein n=1 Tax=Periplaneta americana TaxID=6978 RepID=A0ABQ8TVQ9_PERAM|nr:hypothetical protein ANN_02194 [Periplaneta americana]
MIGSEIRLRIPAITAGGDHHANHTIPPFCLDDRPSLLRHVGLLKTDSDDIIYKISEEVCGRQSPEGRKLMPLSSNQDEVPYSVCFTAIFNIKVDTRCDWKVLRQEPPLLNRRGKSASETYELLKTAFGDKYLNQSNVFLSGSTESKMATNQSKMTPGPASYPLKKKNNENIAKVRDLADCRLKIREMADELNLSFYAVQSILIKDLNMRRVSTKFIPNLRHGKESSYTAVRLPPYHSNLSPIELVWSSVKRWYVARNNKTFKLKEMCQLLDTTLTQVTAEMWQSDIRHIVKEEERIWQMDGITDNMVDRLLINVGERSSDSETYGCCCITYKR